MDIPPETRAVIDLGDANNPERIMCPTCRVIKPTADFNRRATVAQAKAWGYSARVRLEYVGKSCNSCNKPPKPLSKLTPKQIKQRISSGNHEGSEGRAKSILENRIARGKAGIAQGVKNRSEKHAKESWNTVLTALKLASKRYTRQISDIKAKVDTPQAFVRPRHYPPLPTPHPSRSSSALLASPHARIAYTTLILATARAKIKQIKEHIANGQKKPDSITRWQDLITEQEREKIKQHFDAIPPEQRATMRQSAVLNYFKY